MTNFLDGNRVILTEKDCGLPAGTTGTVRFDHDDLCPNDPYTRVIIDENFRDDDEECDYDRWLIPADKLKILP